MRVTKATAVAIAGAFLVALAAGASAIKIKKTELPEAVREAVDLEAPGAHVVACWRIAGDGETMYEVDLKVHGRKKGFDRRPGRRDPHRPGGGRLAGSPGQRSGKPPARGARQRHRRGLFDHAAWRDRRLRGSDRR